MRLTSPAGNAPTFIKYQVKIPLSKNPGKQNMRICDMFTAPAATKVTREWGQCGCSA
jgi:hypothetical protein